MTLPVWLEAAVDDLRDQVQHQDERIDGIVRATKKDRVKEWERFSTTVDHLTDSDAWFQRIERAVVAL